MSELKICRICLQTEAKMYKFDQYQLLCYYEEVMAQKVNEADEIPQYFCYECATLLHKFHKFKEKCYRGIKMFKELLWKGPITYERIYKVNRPMSNLTSSLGVIKVSKNVKTFTTTSTIDELSSDDEVKVEDDSESEECQEVLEDCPVEEDKYKFPVCNEPEIYLDSLKTSTDEKIKGEISDDIKPPLSDNDEPTNTDFDDVELEYEGPCSPTTVFVDEKKEIVKLISEPLKEKKGTPLAVVEPAERYKFKKKKVKFLDAKYWKKVVLTEEEAVKQFRARAEDTKYQTFKYKCQDCFKGFTKEEIMKRHRLLKHNESLPLECRFCHARYKWNTLLRQHMRQHFNRFECLRCRLVCPLESTAVLHDDYHNGVTKKCIHCDEVFTHLSTYYSHLRSHRSDYICTLCGVSFVSPAGLQQHKKIKHINYEMESPDDDEEVNTFCEKCDIQFETRKAYDEHLFHSAMHLDGVEEELKNKATIPRKILGKREKAKIKNKIKSTRSSTIPETSFNYAKKRASKKRNPRKPTDCHQCGAHFETQAACMKHHKKEHPRTSFYPSSQRHICEICGASLAPGSVANHTNMHTKEKTFECDICGRAFHATISLKRHRLTHTGEKPFGCSLCDKKFTQSNSMKLHYRTFHLKQPYPKRNRRQKDEPKTQDVTKESEMDESEDSLPLANVNDKQYLTLH